MAAEPFKHLDPVRKRPGMYIGDTSDGSGLLNMVFELVDNAIEEVLAGHADLVSVTLNADGSATVEDNGRGIPTAIQPEGVSAAEVIMTGLFASSRFDPKPCKVEGGPHGVGVSVVNALSAKLELTIWRGGKEHFMAFADGLPEAPLREVAGARGRTGTRITFTPSPRIFSQVEFGFQTLEHRLRELAFLVNASAGIVLRDLRGPEPVTCEFKYDGGLRDFVKYLDRARTPLFAEPVFIKSTHGGVGVEAALWWNSGYDETMLCFTNTVPQPDGGSHVTGFRTALTRTVNTYAAAAGMAGKEKVKHTGEGMRKGLTCVLSVIAANPNFAGATKGKLASREVQNAVQAVTADALGTWFNEHPQEARLILQKTAGARERG